MLMKEYIPAGHLPKYAFGLKRANPALDWFDIVYDFGYSIPLGRARKNLK
jgi:hypothetical protein